MTSALGKLSDFLLYILYGIVIVTIVIDSYFSMVALILFIVPTMISQFTLLLSSLFQNGNSTSGINLRALRGVASIIAYLPYYQITLSYVYYVTSSFFKHLKDRLNFSSIKERISENLTDETFPKWWCIVQLLLIAILFISIFVINFIQIIQGKITFGPFLLLIGTIPGFYSFFRLFFECHLVFFCRSRVSIMEDNQDTDLGDTLSENSESETENNQYLNSNSYLHKSILPDDNETNKEHSKSKTENNKYLRLAVPIEIFDPANLLRYNDWTKYIYDPRCNVFNKQNHWHWRRLLGYFSGLAYAGTISYNIYLMAHSPDLASELLSIITNCVFMIFLLPPCTLR